MCWVTHWVNGSPVNPVRQTHIAIWLRTRHSAFGPHSPGHGSLHFWLIHAKWLRHSAFETHSGLQLGGAPINSLKQEQDGEAPLGRHSAFGPQGDGWHGLTGSAGFSTNLVYKCKHLDHIRVVYLFIFVFTYWVAYVEWISFKMVWTCTNWAVIDHIALSFKTASTNTRVGTFLIETCQV